MRIELSSKENEECCTKGLHGGLQQVIPAGIESPVGVNTLVCVYNCIVVNLLSCQRQSPDKSLIKYHFFLARSFISIHAILQVYQKCLTYDSPLLPKRGDHGDGARRQTRLHSRNHSHTHSNSLLRPAQIDEIQTHPVGQHIPEWLKTTTCVFQDQHHLSEMLSSGAIGSNRAYNTDMIRLNTYMRLSKEQRISIGVAREDLIKECTYLGTSCNDAL